MTNRKQLILKYVRSKLGIQYSAVLVYDTWRHNSSNQAAVTSMPLRSPQAMMCPNCIMSYRLVHLPWPIYSDFERVSLSPHESKCTVPLWNWPHRSSPFLCRSPCIIILQTHNIVMVVMMISTVVEVIVAALNNSSLQHQTHRPCPFGAQSYDRVKNNKAYIVLF